jgi:hypothetical protein
MLEDGIARQEVDPYASREEVDISASRQEVDPSASRQGKAVGPCERGNGPQGSTTGDLTRGLA